MVSQTVLGHPVFLGIREENFFGNLWLRGLTNA